MTALTWSSKRNYIIVWWKARMYIHFFSTKFRKKIPIFFLSGVKKFFRPSGGIGIVNYTYSCSPEQGEFNGTTRSSLGPILKKLFNFKVLWVPSSSPAGYPGVNIRSVLVDFDPGFGLPTTDILIHGENLVKICPIFVDFCAFWPIFPPFPDFFKFSFKFKKKLKKI